jgi:hypothetical protein
MILQHVRAIVWTVQVLHGGRRELPPNVWKVETIGEVGIANAIPVAERLLKSLEETG